MPARRKNENKNDGAAGGGWGSDDSDNVAAVARSSTDAAKKRKKKQMISELESFNVEGNEEERQKNLNDRGCRKRKKINDGGGDVADDEAGQITPRVNNTRNKSTSTNCRSRYK